MSELRGKEEELRKRILAAGVSAMGERGGVGARAVEIIWESVVGWDEEVVDIEGVELKVKPALMRSRLILSNISFHKQQLYYLQHPSLMNLGCSSSQSCTGLLNTQTISHPLLQQHLI